MVLGLREVAARVADDAEHVVHVGQAVVLLEDLPQHLLGLVELALLVVLAAEEQELLDVLVHLRAYPGDTTRGFAIRYAETPPERERDFTLRLCVAPRLCLRRAGLPVQGERVDVPDSTGETPRREIVPPRDATLRRPRRRPSPAQAPERRRAARTRARR